MGMNIQQQRSLAMIQHSLEQDGIAPTFEEFMEGLGLHSKSGVHRILTALEERGHIHRLHKRARAIALGPGPVEVSVPCPNCQHPVRVFV